jgi:hypothetical protein
MSFDGPKVDIASMLIAATVSFSGTTGCAT